MNCPSCGAPMRPRGDALQCDYCHNVVVPGKSPDGVRILAESPNQPCPVCAIPLMQAALDQTPILACTKCRGIAVPMQAFETLIAAARTHPTPAIAPSPAPPDPASAPPDLNRRIPCPTCHRTMDAHFYAGAPGNVVIDSCEQCLLIWLDFNELPRIAHAPDTLASCCF